MVLFAAVSSLWTPVPRRLLRERLSSQIMGTSSRRAHIKSRELGAVNVGYRVDVESLFVQSARHMSDQ